ncbi:hypothetical protein PMAYCL1PPCAC_30559, partial [Pristionchus mayeri]
RPSTPPSPSLAYSSFLSESSKKKCRDCRAFSWWLSSPQLHSHSTAESFRSPLPVADFSLSVPPHPQSSNLPRKLARHPPTCCRRFSKQRSWLDTKTPSTCHSFAASTTRLSRRRWRSSSTRSRNLPLPFSPNPRCSLPIPSALSSVNSFPIPPNREIKPPAAPLVHHSHRASEIKDHLEWRRVGETLR